MSPDPIQSRTIDRWKDYRVVRGNNQPDELLPYDWHAVFSSSLVLNADGEQQETHLDFPVRITGATLAIKQATGGIITPPSGTETEKYEYVPLSATGNQFQPSDPALVDGRSVVRPSEPSEGVRRDADLCVRGHRRHEIYTLRRFQRGAVSGGASSASTIVSNSLSIAPVLDVRRQQGRRALSHDVLDGVAVRSILPIVVVERAADDVPARVDVHPARPDLFVGDERLERRGDRLARLGSRALCREDERGLVERAAEGEQQSGAPSDLGHRAGFSL